MYIQCNSDPTQHTTDSTTDTTSSTIDLYSASNEALVLQFESMNENELDYGIDFT